jgi:hypothetical protein
MPRHGEANMGKQNDFYLVNKMNSDVDPNFVGVPKKCKISFAEDLGGEFFSNYSVHLLVFLWFLLFFDV